MQFQTDHKLILTQFRLKEMQYWNIKNRFFELVSQILININIEFLQ